MTRGEFLLEVKDEIRGTCALPYSIPDKEINRIINQAKKYFYRNYKEAVESQHYVIPKEEFKKAEFKRDRTILMPECVVSIYECKEISGGGRLFSVDPDFSDNRLMGAELYLSPFQSDDLVMRTAQYAYWDLAQAFFLETIAYDFNRNTSKLKIKGRNPAKNVYLQTYVEIQEEALFEDWLFIRYVTATVKVALGRILGFFEYQLPGGVSINSSDIKSEGTEELDKLLQQIDDENSPDWFFMFH
jgi:hypothetical protein